MACIGGSNHLKRIPAHVIDLCGIGEGLQFRLTVLENLNKTSFVLRPRHDSVIETIRVEWYTIHRYEDYAKNVISVFAKHEDLSDEEFNEWCFEILRENRENEIT